MDKIIYKHDCGNCRFLGNFYFNEEMHDLYFCPKGNYSDLIARFGDEGWEYASLSLDTFLHLSKQGAHVETWNTVVFAKAVHNGLINIECKGGDND